MSVVDDSTFAQPASVLFDAIASHGQLRTFPPRTIIIQEGDVGDSIYLIRSGRGKIYSTNAAGKEIVYNMYGPGDTLGEPMLDGGGRTASVMTLDKTVCWTLRIEQFKQLISEQPNLAISVIFRMIKLVRTANEHVKSLALEDVYGRVVRLLMKTAVAEESRWVVYERLTQQSIADRVGASREMVSRIFKDLEKGEYLSVDDGRIVIHRKPPAGW